MTTVVELRSAWIATALCTVALMACEGGSGASTKQPMAPSGGLVGPTGGGTGGLASGGTSQPTTGGVVDQGSGGAAPITSGGMATGGTEVAVSGGDLGSGGGVEPATGGSQPAGSYDYVDEVVVLTSDLVVPAGETLRVGPGTTFEAGANVSIRVEGTLIVEGTSDRPVRFTGDGNPRSWPGIVVESGGRVEMTDFEVVDANYGIHAKPGSGYTLEAGEFGNSFKAMVLQADGMVRNARVHATDGFGFALVNEVSIEGVNGTLTIIDASPTVENSTFDGGSNLVDMIRVGGNSAPTFDHLYITGAHCGIHANGADRPGIVVRNSIFEGMSYGLMLYTSAPTIEDSVFLNNSADYGFCFGATTQHRPTLSGNFYSDTTPLVDPSCFQIGVDEASPATTQNPDAGPQGL